VRVRCTQLFASAGPRYGEPIEEHPRLRVGEEYVVLSVLVDRSLWTVGLQLLEREGDRGSWYPAAMFERVSTRIPSNWVVQLWTDGSLHLAPEPWLRPGFYEGYVDGERNGPAARAIFDRELAIIIDEA
jgi:hypothetical protein